MTVTGKAATWSVGLRAGTISIVFALLPFAKAQDAQTSCGSSVLPGCDLQVLQIAVGALEEEIRGCWKQEDFAEKFPRVLIYCFRDKGKFQGWATEGGGGHDFGGSWRMEGSVRFSVNIRGTESIQCNFNKIGETTIIFFDCNEITLNGSYNATTMPED